jgi:hypothetical protein
MSKQNPASLLDHPDIAGLVFHPRKFREPALPPGVEELWTPAAESVSVNTRLYLAGAGQPHILFFHGNGEIAADYDDIGPIYTRLGLSFLVSDYRGYGKSGGRPNGTRMLGDARAVLKHVARWMEENRRSGPLWVMGRSLGSAPALELAAEYPDQCRGLIVESGFAFTLDLLERIGAPIPRASGLDAADRVNIDKIGRYAGPTLILHAELDGIIPRAHASALYEASPAAEKKLYIVEGADHNTILPVAGQNYFHVIRSFIQDTEATART